MNAEKGRAEVEPRADQPARGDTPTVVPEASAAAAETGRCKYPGCRRARQPRMNRRGAPPAYCADPTHEPDAARRERVRRRRLGLAPDAVLDAHDRPVTEIDPVPQPEVDQSWPGWCELPQPRGPAEALTQGHDTPIAPATATMTAATASSGPMVDGPGVLAPGDPAALARRLADQLALAATAYEQLAEQIAVTDAENAELRERLQAMETPPGSESDPEPSPE